MKPLKPSPQEHPSTAKGKSRPRGCLAMHGRSASWVLVAGLTSLVFAGCISGGDDSTTADPVTDLSQLSQPVFDEIESFRVQVPGHDGKLQDNFVYKPKTDDPDARFPVFINFSPYWGNSAPSVEDGGDNFAQYMINEYVPRGYAVVLASVRGTGNSEGCFPIGGITEMEDAYAVIDYFANVEWSNGNVGSGGKSYDGTTIQGIAGYKPHPALKLAFPVSGISDLYRYNYRGGVPYFQGPIFNTYYYAGVGVNQGAPADQGPSALADDVVCPELPMVQGQGVSTGATGMYNDYWDERDYNRYVDNVETAFFYVHGLQDWNVKPDHILPWIDSLQGQVPMKIWLHQWQEAGTGHVYPMRADWNETMLRMMDYFLKEIDTGILDEPNVQVQDSEGVWRSEWAWPPTRAQPVQLYLNADSAIAFDAHGGFPAERAGDFTFTMDIAETIRFAGSPVFRGSLMTSDPYGAFSVQMLLTKDGKTEWVNEGVLRAYLRDSMHEPSPVVAAQYYDYEIEFYPGDTVLPAGSSLSIMVSQTESRYAVLAPNNQVRTGIDFASEPHVEVLAFDLIDDVVDDPQPVAMACFAC